MSKPYPSFSVLISVYYREKAAFLNESIESVFKQTLSPTEVVLILDGPLTEDLYIVVSRFKSRYPNKLNVIQLDENVGLGKALQIGLKECKYEYIARMDSDDISVETRFQEQLDYMLDNPNIDVLGSDIGEFYDDSEIIIAQRKVHQNHNEIVNSIKHRSPMNHVTVMMKKSSVLASGNYLPLSYVEDYYLWIRMICNGAVFHNIQKNLVLVRTGESMYKRRGNKEYIKSWRVINKLMLKKRMISRVNYVINMVIIRIFIYIPGFIKEFVYRKFLRKGGQNE